jgi:Mg-chelatase subunit ChlD
MNSDFSKLPKEERELRLTALALGELTPAEAEETHQAIAADAELAREFERLKQTVELIRETSAMDRKVSHDGTPLRLDEARRKKLLETFQTPAPVAVKPRRRRKLWFVPMSAAALLIGLLVISVTELGNIGPWRRAREMAQRTSFSAWDGAMKPYVTGTYFSGEEKHSNKRLNVLGRAQREMALARGGSPGTVPELAGLDFDADGSVAYARQSPASSQPSDSRAKMAGAGSIALPAVTAGDEVARAQISPKWMYSSGNDQGAAWNSYGSGLLGEQQRQPLPQVAAKAETFGDAKSSGLLSPNAPPAGPVVAGEVMYNPAPAPAWVGQASVGPQRTTLTVEESPTADLVVSADNTSPQAGIPATAPAELSKEITNRFGRAPDSVKGIDWEESRNRDSQGKSELSFITALPTTGGREGIVYANDGDILRAIVAQETSLRDTKDSPARNLYLGAEPAAASKPIASTPPAEGLKEQGMSVYSVNAVGYANLDLKTGYNLIDNPLNQPSNSREFPKSDPSSAGAGPKLFSQETIAPTVTDPNRGEAAKLVQDGKLYYATEARLREIGSKQLLTEVEQAWSSPVARLGVSAQAGNAAGFGGGGASYAQSGIAGGRGGGGRGTRTPGNLVGRTIDDDPAQPARPETRIENAVIDSRSLAGAIDGLTGPQTTVEAKFMDVTPDNSLALGIDSFGNTALKNQGLDQDRAVRGTSVGGFYFRSTAGDVGGPVAPASGTVVYQNGAEVVVTNGLVSNQSWGLGANTPAFNDSSWFGKDGKLSADAYHFSVGANPTPPLSYQWRVSGDEPAPWTNRSHELTGNVGLADGSGPSGGDSLRTLIPNSEERFGNNHILVPALPPTAGDKSFVANYSRLGSVVAPPEPGNVTAYSFGQSQQDRRSGARDVAPSDPGNTFQSRLAGAVSRSAGGAGGAGPAARGLYDDDVNAALAGVRGDAVRENGRVDIQLPAPANESQLNRQSSPTQPLNERTRADFSGQGIPVPGIVLGVDIAGLPIVDSEAKKIDQVALGGAFIVAEDKLEKKSSSTTPAETGKPVSTPAPVFGGAIAPVTDNQVAAEVAVRMTPPRESRYEIALQEELRESQLDSPRSMARTNRFFARNPSTISALATEGLLGHTKPDVVAPGSLLGSASSKDAGIDGEKRVPARPSAPAPTPHPEVLTRENAFSTFSLNVSDVSFKLAAASLEKGAMPEVANIRSEEFINAFDYRDPMPAPGAPIAFAWERARYPFAHNRDVVRFSVKTAAQGREAGKPLNIVLLLDNSGSMERADRVRIIQESLRTLAAQLKPQDKLSVVTFSRTARLWADGVAGAQAAEVANKIGELTPEGGTNLEDALDLAYRTALRHYAATAVNRVVLLTDGAANLGNVEPKELKAKVENFRKQGVALDCFGIGWEGFNDDLLEQLSRNGDGRYGFVNTPEEAASEFVGQLAGALRVAASDVKMQVEFNPRRVTAYRQIGYAKHQLTKEQFRDNKVDAAEIGAAESGNALYVIETNPNGEGPIATVRARFRVPQTSDYREHEWVVPFGSAVELEQASPSLRLAASASAFAEWLASSPFAGDVRTDRLLTILSGVPETYGVDPSPKKLEWMIRQAKSISGK